MVCDVKTVFLNDSVNLRRVGRNGLFSRSIYAISWAGITIVFFIALFGSLAFSQERKPVTLTQISDLLKDGVRPSRIAEFVERYGVDFELNEAASRRLKAAGADEVVLSAVKKMAARYTEEQQRRKRSEAEEDKRQRDAAERKRQEEAKRQETETARGLEEVRKRLQEEATKGEEEKRIAEARKRQQAEAEKATKEPARKAELPKKSAEEEARQRSPQGNAARLLSQEDVGRIASLRKVETTAQGEVSGEVVNNSKQTLRDVQLQIVYSWRWKNEYHPGKDDPGMATYYVLDQEIPPGKTAHFNYKPSPPFAARTDGEFDITVKVVGFAEVFPGVAPR